MTETKKMKLIQVIEQLQNGEGNEIEADKWIELLIKETKCPEISNYIFWSKDNLTAIEILQKALDYKKIQLY